MPADVEEQLEVLDRVHVFVKLVGEHEFPDRTLTLRYRFVHVLYQNALYATLQPTRRAAMSGKVAARARPPSGAATSPPAPRSSASCSKRRATSAPPPTSSSPRRAMPPGCSPSAKPSRFRAAR